MSDFSLYQWQAVKAGWRVDYGAFAGTLTADPVLDGDGSVVLRIGEDSIRLTALAGAPVVYAAPSDEELAEGGRANSPDDRINSPETADDYLLAAQAWATGLRSHWNEIQTACVLSERAHMAPSMTAEADSAKAQALATVASAMFAREAVRPGPRWAEEKSRSVRQRADARSAREASGVALRSETDG